MIGIALEIPRAPPATSPTVIDVTVEELCTMLVARIPIKRPTKGFEVVSRSCSAKSFPKYLKDAPIKDMLTKKMYIKNSRMANLIVAGVFLIIAISFRFFVLEK